VPATQKALRDGDNLPSEIEAMKKRKLGTSGCEVAPLAFGGNVDRAP